MVYGEMGLGYMYHCITMGRSPGPPVPSVSSTAHTLSSSSRPVTPPAVLVCSAHGRSALAPTRSIRSSGAPNGGKKQPTTLATHQSSSSPCRRSPSLVFSLIPARHGLSSARSSSCSALTLQRSPRRACGRASIPRSLCVR
jgi:hypothetical protein